MLAGSVSESEQRSLQGIPGLVKIPGIRELTSATTKSTDAGEILVTITPNIVRTLPLGTDVREIFAPGAK